MPTLKRGSLFDPALVEDLVSKVQGHSSVAALSKQTPIPFNGQKEFTFSMDKEIDIVAESGKKSEGGITVEPITILPIKFEYGARISDEFLLASEEEKIEILKAFNDGFAKKASRGLDLASFHGVNPRTGQPSAVVNGNSFDDKVTQKVTYTSDDPEANLQAASDLVQGSGFNMNGMAFAPAFSSALGNLKVNGIRQYPQFMFGANPGDLNGMKVDVNSTVAEMSTEKDVAIIGDFANMFKWGYAKQIPLQIIQYGDPDNTGRDLAGHNEIYIRSELYLGWGIMAPNAFARIAEAEA